MTDPRLPYDTCRCHDDTCQVSPYCWRYLLRNTGGTQTPHAKSLRPAERTQCDMFIGEEDPNGL